MMLFVIVKRECIRELLILQHARFDHQSTGLNRVHSASIMVFLILFCSLIAADIDHENDQVP